MADSPERLAKGSITTSEVTIYTVPASTTTLVSRLTIANTTGADIAFTLKIATTEVLANISIPAGSFVEWDTGHWVLATETITIQGSTTGLRYYLSGVEIV